MIGLECDDRDLERSLRKFERQVNAAGGWLSDAVTIVAKEGNIWVETAHGPANHDLLMSVPEEALLPVDQVEWRLSGDDLCIGAFKPGLSRARQELFETMVEIFNSTDKIANHRRQSPGYALSDDRETFDHVMAGREQKENRDEDADQALIRDFFHTRIFDFAHGKQAKGSEDVVMPFIGFLNHHPLAMGFQRASEKHKGQPVIASVNSKPDTGSRECFAQYGIFDAYDMFTTYAFVERTCAFVRSVPLTIDLEGVGKIVTRAVPGVQFNKELPPQAADLAFYMPMAGRREPKTVVLSHLIIPGPRAPRALQRVLARFISALKPKPSQEALVECVKEAERRVLTENVAYYEGLRARAQAAAARGATGEIYSMAEELAEMQLERLRGYSFMG